MVVGLNVWVLLRVAWISGCTLGPLREQTLEEDANDYFLAFTLGASV
jgi:hypothetical protein